MKKELEEQLGTILETLNKVIESGSALVVENTPVIIQQLLAYEFMFANIMYWVGIVLIVIGILIWFIEGMTGFMTASMGLLLAIINWFHAYKIENMPELWLFEYLRHMMNT